MKVHSMRNSGFAAGLSAIAAVAMIASVLVGAGVIPPRSASAQVPERASGISTPAVQQLPSVDATPTADEIRQPSGIAATEIQVAGTRTPTVIRRAVRRAPRVTPAAPAAPAGDGWRSARVSWYGPGFYGHGMAGGGVLEPGSMIVAHRSLPFGTVIQFEYRGNTCTAVVMDRGPFVGGRTFDLGPGTAAALGFSGVGTVQYRIISR